MSSLTKLLTGMDDSELFKKELVVPDVKIRMCWSKTSKSMTDKEKSCPHCKENRPLKKVSQK